MAQYETKSAEIVSDPSDEGPEGYSAPDQFDALGQWVATKVESWRTWRDSQYASKWDEYERLWRGIWSTNERLRESERSKIVAPALSEAVENGAAEIEEATFGRGTDYFDLTPYNAPLAVPESGAMPPQSGPMGMTDPAQGPMGAMDPSMPPPGMAPMAPPVDPAKETRRKVDTVRTNLKEDLGRVDFAAQASKCILNSAVFGLGVGEVITKALAIKTPATDAVTGAPTHDTQVLDLGTLRAVHPRNFVYEPLAESVDASLGVAVEENMPMHVIRRAQRSGVFRDEVTVACGTADPRLSGDQVGEAGSQDLSDAIHVIRYYGLVPTSLLYPPADKEKPVELFEGDDYQGADAEEDGDYTEAIVVVAAHGGMVLKAEANPYIMGDRPIVIFPWDVVPGRLQGRGLCEKGNNSQKVLDAEIRARLDALAYVTAPMMGMDANRMPRGFKFVVKPGASILTAGNPAEILHPFKFGELDPNHWTNLGALQAMVQQATGSVDAAAMAKGIGDARSGAVSMALAPIIKRYKRTMVHFLDVFLMPALEKITYRNMQSMPDRYPMVPLKFKAASTMGIMQREYETSQLTALLQVLESGTAEHRAVLMGLVSNTSIPNRDHVLEMISSGEERERIALAMQAMQQQDPMAEQLRSVSIQLEVAEKKAKIRELDSRANLNDAKARETAQSAEMEAMQIASKGIYGLPQEQQKAEWDRRYNMAQLALKQADIDEKRADRASNERITDKQMRMSLLKDHMKSRVELTKAQMAAARKQQAAGE